MLEFLLRRTLQRLKSGDAINSIRGGTLPHWKSMTDRDYIFAFDLNGKDVVVEIDRVVASEIPGSGGRKTKRPVVYFKGKEKGLALNSTNAKTISAMFGSYTEKWIGQRITIYPTTTQMGGETVECIRVRPTPPKPETEQ